MQKSNRVINVGIHVEPGVVLMDIVGVQSIFGFCENVNLIHVGKSREVVTAWGGMPVAATTSYADCPPLDVLAAGAMGLEVYSNPETLQFVRQQASNDPYLIGICAGVLLFGAAGLLVGKRATTNLQCIDRLSEFGCDAVRGGTVVEDGRLLTAGPATGGFEASLTLLSRLRGVHLAKLMELNVEYHPKPVFGVGSATLAGEDLTEEVMNLGRPYFAKCQELALASYKERAWLN
ncbi:DJ-1/PfpI family protein [Achromobacter kerstersii]|uniref:Isonitrile hydratase n=1 Tax=Achromobacter kerstersii TaxID=1353890 RepID=A0A6S6ZBC0_9BURK|nr:DJ-1/PfpI family protein [Achromobacter kerstersii]CAB3665373.1 Isonitrile hydratase [Achromobacter kerstersii]